MWSYTLAASARPSCSRRPAIRSYTNIATCARTMAAMADYRALRERFLRPIEVRPGSLRTRPRQPSCCAAAGPALTEGEARPMLAAYGIGADGPRHACGLGRGGGRRREGIGGPVALKVQSPDILHKTDAGAVALEPSAQPATCAPPTSVCSRARCAMLPEARILGMLVQPMAPPGREVILGVKRDATFGPMLMVGLGGIHGGGAEGRGPGAGAAGHGRALELIAQLQGAALLGAHRGAPAADVDALADLMVRLSGCRRPRRRDRRGRSQPGAGARARQGRPVVDALIVKSRRGADVSRARGTAGGNRCTHPRNSRSRISARRTR